MEHRIVVFADILGFKAMVESIGLDNIANKVSRLFERSKVASVSGSVNYDVGHAHFSDALLFWGPEMTGVSVPDQILVRKSMMSVASNFLGRSIEDEIPLRMGVAEGDVIIDPNSSVYVGQPIIDAYAIESVQEWVGGAIHPSFRSDEVLNSPHYDLVSYQIPYKKSSGFHSRIAVNWQYCTVGSQDVSVDSLRENLCSMRDQAERAPDPGEKANVIRKYDNSIHFLEWASARYS